LLPAIVLGESLKNLSLIAVFLFLSVGVSAHAESGPESATLTGTGAQPVPSEEKVIAAMELRPSWTSRIGEVHSEDYAQLGYQFSKTFQLFYRQEFTTNLFNPGASASGLGLYAYDGTLRARVNDFYKPSASSSVSYEGRVWMPTYSVRRDAGMIVALRNAARIKQSLTSTVSVSLEEIAVGHVFSRSGNVGKNGPEANPWYENRVYLTFEVKPTQSLKFSLPFILTSIKYRDFQAGAKNNDSWGHKVWLYPELTYAIDKHVSVGLAYYSDNLVLANFGGTTINAGLEKGITQVILNATL